MVLVRAFRGIAHNISRRLTKKSQQTPLNVIGILVVQFE